MAEPKTTPTAAAVIRIFFDWHVGGGRARVWWPQTKSRAEKRKFQLATIADFDDVQQLDERESLYLLNCSQNIQKTCR